ncbi:MAG: hypothetical protein ACOYD1_07535 [Candidatus Nanopelagicales bacterium]
MPRPMVLVTLAIYSIARLGKAAGLTDDVADASGHTVDVLICSVRAASTKGARWSSQPWAPR